MKDLFIFPDLNLLECFGDAFLLNPQIQDIAPNASPYNNICYQYPGNCCHSIKLNSLY